MADVSRLAQVRARIELPIARRAAGLLEGRHRSILKGHGLDFDDLRLYAPGEDVGDIDWKASARTGQPVVRRFVRESNLTTVLVVDTGRTMAGSAPSGEAKSEVANFCCALVAYVARDRGDPVALIAGDAERIVQLPARSSTLDLESMLRTVERTWSPEAPASDIDRLLERTSVAYNRRCLLVLVTDVERPEASAVPRLRTLATRHELVVIQVADLSALDMPADPTAPVEDVDEGVLPPFLRTHRSAAQAVAADARARHEAASDLLRRLGIVHVSVRGSDEVPRRFVQMMGRSRRAAPR